MKNSTREVDIKTDAKLKWLNELLTDCFTSNATHSRLIINAGALQESPTAPCPRTFDGFACWDETPAATTAYQACPEFVIGFDPRRIAYKRCTEAGTWYVHPDVNKPWTNYTTCVDVEDLDFRNTVNNIYIGGYSISVAALLLSIIIFIYFRTLQCTRIRIHIHLFVSFALNNILWIVWYKTVVNEVVVVQNNEGWCQILHIVTHYFMVASYVWMFCEGLHLHIALVVVFVKDEVAMRWFICLGWGVSFIIVSLYAAVRYYITGKTERYNSEMSGNSRPLQLQQHNRKRHNWVYSNLCSLRVQHCRHAWCWMDQSDAFWIIVIPVVLSLIASFIFLVNVVRVLLTKLNPAPDQHASLAARKAARAALILIPLFGLHFILIPLRPLPDTPGEKIYQIVSAILTSLQGLCVAILFCFTNHDVMTATKALLTRILRTNEGMVMTGLTGGESIMNTRENVV